MTKTMRNTRSQRVDAAIADYLEAIEQGSPPDRDEFLGEHSDVEPELREFFADYQALERAAPRSLPTHSANPQSLPRSFGQFELLEEIARGGMGVVYKARQSNPARFVALKMILAGRLASQDEVERFHAEAQAAAALDHPNIIPVFEVGQVDDQLYFTMGHVAGPSAADRVAEGPLAARESARIIRDAASAVDYAHRLGVVHRDLKSANILLDNSLRVRVTDFGLAKRQTDAVSLTKTGELLGTPNFMAPEQLTGHPADVGPACDVYALGATLYALLTGRPPFQAATVADVLRQVVDNEPTLPSALEVEIPCDLESIALKCLEKSPSSRYASAQDLANDLVQFLADRPIVARRSTTWERLARWRRRNPLVEGLVAAQPNAQQWLDQPLQVTVDRTLLKVSLLGSYATAASTTRCWPMMSRASTFRRRFAATLSD
jgi:eukaryotic-like serine/threonine-protein kinase